MVFSTNYLEAQPEKEISKIRISLQKRVPSEIEKGSFFIASEIQEWNPSQTAIIICDMWDTHWCKSAADRVAEMAPYMNNVISVAREKGILIVHAPSDCMNFYKNHPARRMCQKYKSKKVNRLITNNKLDSEKDAVWPIDQSDGGCDCEPECKQGPPWPWTRQIASIEISDKDAISDSGSEIGGLFYQRGIKNVILMGVHANMCVIGRTFGLRNMVRLGMNVVLMRDMTDTMYDSKQWPNVNHFTGNSFVNEYIETYVCPSIASTDLTGKKQFRFMDDKRPLVAFLTAENEYRSNMTLPGFAHEMMMKQDVNCEFAVGKPTEEGDDRHNLENIQILEDADLVVIYIRRRGLGQEKMALLKNFVLSGKPVLGIRTASHAFDPRIKPEQNNPFLASLASWPEFDHDILGGNYLGHTNSKVKSITAFTVVPGMEAHPLLKDVKMENFTSEATLYSNVSLSSDKSQVILYGTIQGEPSQPVLWTNFTGKTNAIYTSVGAVSDFKNQTFRQLLRNCVNYLLDQSKNK